MISAIDLTVSIAYVLLIVGIGLLASLRKKGVLKESSQSGEYFLAGNSLKWPMIGLSLFATNISCFHLVGLAQNGYDSGLLYGNFEWMASFTLILLALFFVPFYLRSKVATLPDFLERRYNRSCRDWLTGVSIVSAIIGHIAFSLLAGGIVLETLLGFNMYISIVVICVLVGLYTILGGLKAVVVTESIQTVVLIAGALIITAVCWTRAGGWSTLQDTLSNLGQSNRLSMLRPGDDPTGIPWYAIFLGYPVLGIWYWCADQTIVQRVLGAKDVNHGRAGALFCGFIKILPVFIFVVPGLFAYVLVQKGQLDISSITSHTADGTAVVNSKGIYTVMITQLLPTGLVGILVAALLSGLMSQIAGALNSISTLVGYDIYIRFRPGATDKQLIYMGRIAAVVSLICSIALLPLLNRYESLFAGINDIIAHIAPPITCVFLLGVFWKKASARAAQYTLWLGSLAGILVFIAAKLSPEGVIGQTNFMLMAFYLFCFCIIVQIVFSTIYPVAHTGQSSTLYWKSPLDPLRDKGWNGMGNYKFLSLLLLLIMVVLYTVFR